MEERGNHPPVQADMHDLRDIAQRLPPANDMESEPMSPENKETPAAASPSPPQRVKSVLLRIRWTALAVLVTGLITLGGASAGSAFVTSEFERWALAMLFITLGLLLVTFADWVLQWPERAVLGLVQTCEGSFLAQARAQAGRMFQTH